MWQFINSCRSPSQVYKLTLHRKQTKNQWARDDPSFVGILLGFLAVVAVAYGIAYRYTSPLAYLWLISQHWMSFFGWGLAAATAGWAVTNKYCRLSGAAPHSVEQSVEWLFAWDIHCNAFVPVLLLVYLADFLLLPLTLRNGGEGLLPCLVGNTLYAAAIGHYFYITFQGYIGESRCTLPAVVLRLLCAVGSSAFFCAENRSIWTLSSNGYRIVLLFVSFTLVLAACSAPIFAT